MGYLFPQLLRIYIREELYIYIYILYDAVAYARNPFPGFSLHHIQLQLQMQMYVHFEGFRLYNSALFLGWCHIPSLKLTF